MNLVKKVVRMLIRQPDTSQAVDVSDAERRHMERLKAKAEATKRALEAADEVFRVVATRRSRE
jgi:hypothetical protein